MVTVTTQDEERQKEVDVRPADDFENSYGVVSFLLDARMVAEASDLQVFFI